jgi:hypothetical protein
MKVQRKMKTKLKNDSSIHCSERSVYKKEVKTKGDDENAFFIRFQIVLTIRRWLLALALAIELFL